MLTLGSLFDGSGGFPLAAKLAGIKPVWASEIEPFPIRVTTKRIPEMIHVGSITEIHGDELPPVDIITFGSPCQNLSMAGNRDGLNGQKSSLFFEAIRIIKEMREKTNGQHPRFILWENVAGAFSSNNGKDFREVLQQIFNITEDNNTAIPQSETWNNAGAVLGNNCSITWRLFDAQFWGVPQRRRRIFLMADFAGGGRFNPVLFEPKGMYGDFGTLQKAWKETSKGFRTGTQSTDKQILIENHMRDARYKESETAPCLTATAGTGGNNQPYVVSETVTFSKVHGTVSAADGPKGIHSQIQKDLESFFVGECYNVCSAGSNTSNMAYKTDISKTLDLHSVSANCNQGGTVCVESNYTMSKDSRQTQFLKDTAFCLYASDYKDPQTVVGHNYSLSKGLRMQKALKDVSHPLMNSDYKDPQTINDNMYVRRLTPLEYCRLQGFPDYWTENLETENPTEEEMTFWRQVFKTYSEVYETPMKLDKQILKWLKNPFTDSAAYKMWGNGVALPVVFYILNTLNNYVQKEKSE